MRRIRAGFIPDMSNSGLFGRYSWLNRASWPSRLGMAAVRGPVRPPATLAAGSAVRSGASAGPGFEAPVQDTSMETT